MFLKNWKRLDTLKSNFTELSGKFKRKDIEEFVSGAEKDIALKQLCVLILEQHGSIDTIPEVAVEINNDIELYDPYGEYGIGFDKATVEMENNNFSTVDILCKIFDVK